MRPALPFLLALSLTACPDASQAPQPATAEPAAVDPPRKPRPETAPHLPPADQPLLPALPVAVVTAPVIDCATLPELAADASAVIRDLVPALAILRGVSCAPELMGLPIADIRRKLEVAKTVEFEVGRRYAAVPLPNPAKLVDIAHAAGVAEPKVKFEQGWGTSWLLVSGAEGAVPQPWGPAQLRVRVRGPRNSDMASGAVEEIPADMAATSLSVVFSEDALSFRDDGAAGRAAASAVQGLADDPTLLSAEPDAARSKLLVIGERFQLTHYSEGVGDEKRSGFHLRPLRTKLGAVDFVRAMAFDPAETGHTAIDITDTNPDRLEVDGQTRVLWRGLELEIELIRDSEAVGLAGWAVEAIMVLPTP